MVFNFSELDQTKLSQVATCITRQDATKLALQEFGFKPAEVDAIDNDNVNQYGRNFAILNRWMTSFAPPPTREKLAKHLLNIKVGDHSVLTEVLGQP